MHWTETDRRLAADSYYAATAPRGAAWPPLAGDAHADVAVAGGGIAGLSAALDLVRQGRTVVLLEADRIGSGASGRNGGQAIHGLACDIELVERQLGLDDARRVWAMSLEALALLRQRLADHAIDADWREGWLGLATSAGKAAELERWAGRLQRVHGFALQPIGRAELPRWIASRRYHRGVFDPRSGHLHPLKYTLGLARAAAAAGVRLHEGSAVLQVDGGDRPALVTAGGTVRAGQLLLATNLHLGGLVPELRARVMPAGTYIACTEALGPDRLRALIPSGAAVCDTNFVVDYFRPTPDHRLLFGGLVSYSTATPAALAPAMHRRLRAVFPQLADARIEHCWGGFVDITMNRAPDFGRLGRHLYYLQGFSGHGLALAGLAGRLVAEAMCGDASRFDVFARLRHRPFPGGRALRMPTLVLAMAWLRLRDMLA